jgi:hypothetical protein
VAPPRRALGLVDRDKWDSVRLRGSAQCGAKYFRVEPLRRGEQHDQLAAFQPAQATPRFRGIVAAQHPRRPDSAARKAPHLIAQ